MKHQAAIALPDGVFLARAAKFGPKDTLDLHTFGGLLASTRMARQARAQGLAPRMIRHHTVDFRRARSLPDMLELVEGGRVTADPSSIFSRAAAIELLGSWIRRAFKGRALHLFLNTSRRTLYVIISPSQGETDNRVAQDEQAFFVRCAGFLLKEWKRRIKPGFELAIRIGTTPPSGVAVVSVDRISAPGGMFDRSWRRLSSGAVAAGLATMLGAPLATAADIDTPSHSVAVESPNVTVITKTGEVDDDFFYGAGAKADFGLTDSLGVQFEGGVGSDHYYGAAAHLFMRDPDVGMIGVYGSAEGYEHVDMQRVAAEAELYLESFSVGGKLGYQGGEVDNGLLASADVTFYVTPNFALRASGEYNPELSLAKMGFEWQPSFTEMWGLSLYADLALGEDGYDSVMAGLNIPFGTNGASLMDRDRRYDPPPVIWNFHPLKSVANKRAKSGTSY